MCQGILFIYFPRKQQLQNGTCYLSALLVNTWTHLLVLAKCDTEVLDAFRSKEGCIRKRTQQSISESKRKVIQHTHQMLVLLFRSQSGTQCAVIQLLQVQLVNKWCATLRSLPESTVVSSSSQEQGHWS